MGKLGEYAVWNDGVGLGGTRRRRLIDRLVRSREALYGALRRLSHPHAGAFENATAVQLEDEILAIAKFSVSRWPRGEKPDVLDLVLSATLKSDLSADIRRRIFGGVEYESDLTAPTRKWLETAGYDTALEVPIRSSRADLVGFTKGVFERDIRVVELKNAVEEVHRLLDQLSDYVRACDSTVVVMTPECMAQVVLDRSELATPLAFAEKVRRLGAHLVVHDAHEGDFQFVVRGSAQFEKSDYDTLWNYLTRRDAAVAA